MKEKIVPFNRKLIVSFSLVSLSFFLDRISKIYVIDFFIKNDFKDFYVTSYLNIILLWNKGIAFGLFESESIFYHLISALIFIVILFICYLTFKTRKNIEIFCYSIIIGGAFGNLFDRFYYNAVPDFIDLHIENFHWFTFNVSDICITIGVLILLTFDIFKFNKKKNEKF